MFHATYLWVPSLLRCLTAFFNGKMRTGYVSHALDLGGLSLATIFWSDFHSCWSINWNVPHSYSWFFFTPTENISPCWLLPGMYSTDWSFWQKENPSVLHSMTTSWFRCSCVILLNFADHDSMTSQVFALGDNNYPPKWLHKGPPWFGCFWTGNLSSMTFCIWIV